jgi:hypothetical protein
MRIDIGETSGSITESMDIFTVYANDFSDDYHRVDIGADDIAVRKIKRRYRNINDFYAARNLYNDYMKYLESLYGPKELFDIALKAGTLPVYIPPKPRLKDNRFLKNLVKNNIVLSVTDKYVKIDKDVYDKIMSEVDTDNKIKLKSFNRDEFISIIQEMNKTGNVYNGEKKSQIDLIEEYFLLKKSPKKKISEDQIFEQPISLTEYYNGGEEIDIQDTHDDDEVVYYENKLMTYSEVEDMKMYKVLYDAGWNTHAMMKKARKGAFSDTVLKVMKNKNKKDKKRKKNDDKFIIDIMQDNGYDDFEDFANEIYNSSFDNIMK